MKWAVLLSLLILAPTAWGTIVHGTVYDFDLNKVSNAVVEINSSPRQKMVTNGTYSFSVPRGKYLLTAKDPKQDLKISEEINALQEGSYVLDLILLPALDEEESLLTEEVEDAPPVEDIVQDKPVTSWLAWLVVFAALGYLVYRVSKSPRVIEKEIVKEEVVREVVSDELQKIVEFVEKAGGRMTQKDIRQRFPHSEAKISLMIDELEAKGILKRLKKGRGNIIIRA